MRRASYYSRNPSLTPSAYHEYSVLSMTIFRGISIDKFMGYLMPILLLFLASSVMIDAVKGRR